MHCISKYTIHGIFSMILNFNQPTILMKPKNLQLRYISILKNKKASGHSHILLTSVRACSSWLNSSWTGTHMLIRYGSMTPRGAHMRPLPSPLRAILLLRNTGPTLAKLLECAVSGVAARQSWAEYSSRPTTHSRREGWAIKDFSVLSEMCSICEQPLIRHHVNYITHQQVMPFNQWSKFANIF